MCALIVHGHDPIADDGDAAQQGLGHELGIDRVEITADGALGIHLVPLGASPVIGQTLPLQILGQRDLIGDVALLAPFDQRPAGTIVDFNDSHSHGESSLPHGQ